MISPDLFVGMVAIGLGGFLLVIAVFNLEWYFKLRKAQWLEGRVGRRGVRCIYSVIGIGLIGLGIAIAMGFAPNAKKNKVKATPRRARLTALRSS